MQKYAKRSNIAGNHQKDEWMRARKYFWISRIDISVFLGLGFTLFSNVATKVQLPFIK